MNNYTRCQKTIKKIENAFFYLKERKEWKKIKVVEIVNKAGINKSTFYSHYEDIYDLVNKIEIDYFDNFIEKNSFSKFIDNPVELLKKIHHFLSNDSYFNKLFEPSRINNYINLVYDNIIHILKKNNPAFKESMTSKIHFYMATCGLYYSLLFLNKEEKSCVEKIVFDSIKRMVE